MPPSDRPPRRLADAVTREVSVSDDAEHIASQVRTGFGIPGPNANGDIFTPEARQVIAMEMHRHIRENLERSMPVRHISRAPVGFSRILSAESPGIERVMRVIQEEHAVSMGCSVPYEPRGVLGGEPAFQPASVMGPDELSRYPTYFTARERIGIGVINPRGVARLGLTGGGEEHPEGFRTEHLGTFSNPDSHTETLTLETLQRMLPPERPTRSRLADLSHVVNPADRSAVLGTRVTMPEFEIPANPRIHMGDVRSRRYNLMDRTMPKPLPFNVDDWIMSNGLILQVETATHETLTCRIWDPQHKLFIGTTNVAVSEACSCPEPPARTTWDWLMMD